MDALDLLTLLGQRLREHDGDAEANRDGLGAAAGAALGAIAGGGTGAAIGAGAGALVGAGGGYLWSQHMQEQKQAMEAATQGPGVAVTQTANNELKF